MTEQLQIANAEQVAALFAERQRYEQWLAALERRRATTPPHIYNRVHADYTARLQRTIEELSAHRAVLQELERSLMDRLTALDIDESKQRDEASEAELRATVGELSPEHNNEVQMRTEAAITAIVTERDQLSAELAHLRALLDAGGAPSAPAVPAAQGGAEVAAEPQRPPAPVTTSTSTPSGTAVPRASQTVPPAPDERGDWELGFEAPAGVRTQRPSGERPAERTASSSSMPKQFDDLEFLKSVVDSRGGADAAANGAAPAPERRPPSTSATATPDKAAAPVAARGGSSAPPETTSTSTPISRPSREQPAPSFHKDSPPEQVKTLKCQECGTLNYPTEWYCERCGAELAAL